MPDRPVSTERKDPNAEFEPEKTDPAMPVDAEYFKRKLGEEMQKHDRKMTLRGWAMAFVSAVVAVAAVVILVIIFIDNRVAAQTDAGVKVHEERLTTLEQERKDDKVETSNRMNRMEQNQNDDHGLILDANKKLDVVIKALGAINPAPTPKDGGK